MRIAIPIIVAVLGSAALAQSPRTIAQPPVAPPPPPPPPAPIFSNRPSLPNPTPSALNPQPPREPGNWQRLQDSVDRSTGRITNESLYETERLQRLRDERSNQLVPRSEFDRFQEERERRLRIEEQARRQNLNQQQIQQELDRREYNLFLNSPVAGQAAADEQALRNASAQRDAQILEANDVRTQALRQNPGNAEQIEANFQQRAQQIRDEYYHRRQAILGFPPTTAPTTAPAPTPPSDPVQ